MLIGSLTANRLTLESRASAVTPKKSAAGVLLCMPHLYYDKTVARPGLRPDRTATSSVYASKAIALDSV